MEREAWEGAEAYGRLRYGAQQILSSELRHWFRVG